jgi:hypothetical protein
MENSFKFCQGRFKLQKINALDNYTVFSRCFTRKETRGAVPKTGDYSKKATGD